MIIPNWTPLNIAFYLVFGVFALCIGFADYYEWMPLRYSKFAVGKGVPSRLGMFFLYFAPIVAATICASPYLPAASLIQWVVYGAIMFHFAKRVLEALFLHKYSGHMQVFSMGVILSFYSFLAGMISWLNADASTEMGIGFYLGIILFLVGEASNFYHHILLARLRTKESGYFIPRGGWFEGAACPHYFFELLAWLGIALLSQHLFAVLALIAMIGYLTARSIKTRQWYQRRFPDYPAERRLMIPFVF